MIRIAVITISDRAYQGIYEDLSGKKVEEVLKAGGIDVNITKTIVPDERRKILKALKVNYKRNDFIFTTGGTGISSRDVTPETCEAFCDKALNGISETLRAISLKETPFAMLSRGYAGIKGNCIIINFPGSVKAAECCVKTILPILEHSLKMLRDESH